MSPFDFIRTAGYDVYQRPGGDTYCYFTDGTRIGYCQFHPVEGYTLSSVHRPNQKTGTGYQVLRYAAQPTTADLETALNTIVPAWDRLNNGTVVKFRSMDTFLSSSKWNKEFTKQ